MPTHQEPLDASAGDKPDKEKSPLVEMRSAVVTMVVTIVQTGLIAWFGFTLSGRLELAIKERQATVDGATAMANLIKELRATKDEKKDDDDYRSLMLQLSMYGADAIGPMVMMAMSPGPYGPDIPIFGLQRLGITHHKATCQALRAGKVSDAWIQDPVRGPQLEQLSKEMQC